MSIGGILIGIVLVIVVTWLVAAPFFSREQVQSAEKAREIATFQVQYERILTNIRDLDEDYALGKITEAFYNTERSRLASAGVSLLQAMDASTQQPPSDDLLNERLDADIEAAIAARRGRTTQTV